MFKQWSVQQVTRKTHWNGRRRGGGRRKILGFNLLLQTTEWVTEKLSHGHLICPKYQT